MHEKYQPGVSSSESVLWDPFAHSRHNLPSKVRIII